MVILVRALIGLAFASAGAYVGYYATHPVATIPLIIAAGLFLTGGLVMDFDDVGNALVRLAQVKLPSMTSNRDNS